MHAINPLKAEINYYHPFVYRDPVLQTLKHAYFLNSDGKLIYFLHSYTYQYYKHRNKLNDLRKFSHFKSIYETCFENKEESFYENDVLFCRYLPSDYIKGSVNEFIGSDIPLSLLSIELPTEWEHHINVVFEIYEYSKMEKFKNDPFLLDWVLYATDKLSTLPLRQEIREKLLAILCECTLPEGIQEQLSIVIPFRSDPKNHNAIYYEMLTNQF